MYQWEAMLNIAQVQHVYAAWLNQSTLWETIKRADNISNGQKVKI